MKNFQTQPLLWKKVGAMQSLETVLSCIQEQGGVFENGYNSFLFSP